MSTARPVPPDALTSCPRCRFDLSGPRSGRAHRFFHVVTCIAWEQWPSSHEQQFTSAEHFRGWALTDPRVDWCDRFVVGPDEISMKFAQAIMERARAQGGYAVATTENGQLVVKVARTTALPAKGGPLRRQFYALVTRFMDFVEEEAGIDRQAMRAAGLRAVAPNGFRKRRAA
jgi:hypothetical protein